MNVLVLGSGGREHAIAWKLKQSPKVKKVYIGPGNCGTKEVGVNVYLDIADYPLIKDFIIGNTIDMMVVGPEQPLVGGIVDFIKNDKAVEHVAVVGPSKAAAQLEGSKDFAKKFMIDNNIPTAKYKTITKENISEGEAFLDSLDAPYVLKADGLAAGKGVLILDKLTDAKKQLSKILEGKFGIAGNKVVIEEYLHGIEMSVFVLTDGKSYKILPEAKDYKRIGEGDKGPNTGGMGAVSPVPFADASLMKTIEDEVIKPTVEGIKKDNLDYKGFIFIGLMIKDGKPFVIEYNVRLGDPETEVIIPRIKTDLMDLFEATCNEGLDKIDIDIDPKTAATVILASEGYPDAYEKGKLIKNLDKVQNSIVFHAGTKEFMKKTLTNGGRVLAITSLGKDKDEALKKSYNSIDLITFSGMTYRKDIGFDL